MKVLVTGFNGLGEEIVTEFLKHNYDIIATYNNSKDYSINRIKELKNKYKNNIELVKCDLSKEKDINNLVNKYQDVDIIINNAAISLDSKLKEKTKEEFMKVLEVNVVGTFLLTREFLLKTKVQTILNVSSTDSIDTYSNYNIDYSISKLGINFMTKIFSENFKDKKIVAVLPNWINTKSVLSMNEEYLKEELKRIGQQELLKKEEVANKIYEISTNKKYKTGEMVRIG